MDFLERQEFIERPYGFSSYIQYSGTSSDFNANFNDGLVFESHLNPRMLEASSNFYINEVSLPGFTINITGGPLTYRPPTKFTCYFRINKSILMHFVVTADAPEVSTTGITVKYVCNDNQGIRTIDAMSGNVLTQSNKIPIDIKLVPGTRDDIVVNPTTYTIVTQPSLTTPAVIPYTTTPGGGDDLVKVTLHLYINGRQRGVTL